MFGEPIDERLSAAKQRFIAQSEKRFDDEMAYWATATSSEHEVAIVTALPLEFKAMDRLLGNGIDVSLPSRLEGVLLVRSYRLSCKRRDISILLGMCPKMGNNASAVVATALLTLFPSIDQIVMCGIAGGVPSLFRNGSFPQKEVELHVRLGDAVIGTKGIVQYDFIAKKIDGDQLRADPSWVSARARNAANEIQTDLSSCFQAIAESLQALEMNDEVWKAPPEETDIIYDYEIDGSTVRPLETILPHPPSQPGRTPNFPFVHFGKIGSANILLKQPTLREELRLRGVSAVEMEASGVADASWAFGVGAVVIRGICDYCDFSKGDAWQPRAAAVAAALTRLLLKHMY